MTTTDTTAPTFAPTVKSNPGWLDFVLMVGVAVFMCLIFYGLLRLSKRWTEKMLARIKEAENRRKANRDSFRIDNGYSWDCCVVFKVRKTEEVLTPKQNANSIKKIVNKLNNAGLETRLFYSCQHDEVYCKIRCPLRRLMLEADRVNYKLLLDAVTLETVMTAGRPPKWNGVTIPHPHPQTSLSPFEYIYAEYRFDQDTNNTREDLINIYKRRANGTYFRGIDRMKLICGIIRAREFEGGCFLDMRSLQLDNCICGFIMLHDMVELRTLEANWLVFFQFPWKQEIDMVKGNPRRGISSSITLVDYFGEKVGIYFLWLGHYTSWLFPAGIIGILAWANVAADDNNPNAAVIPYYSGFMALWATSFLESWKRKESFYAMRWGTVGYEEEEQARPQFQGELMPSAVNGEMELYFSETEFARRSAISVSIITVVVIIVLGVVASLFMLRLVMMHANVQVGGTQVGPILTSIIQAVVIGILNFVYGYIATSLNNNENHRTDTEYEDNLIGKVFIFQYVNSYAALFYVAFIKPYIQNFDPCLKNDCMVELQTTLGTLFITRLATGIILSTTLPIVFQRMRENENFAGLTPEQLKDISEIERSFMKEPYDVFLGTFNDFADMAIQFGYTTMFISAFPLATAMSFVNNYIMLRLISCYLRYFFLK